MIGLVARLRQQPVDQEYAKLRKELFAAELEKSAADFQRDLQAIKDHEATCAICGQRIEDMLTIVPHHVSDEPCHFECVQKELVAAEELAENESLVYFGNGDFAVVQDRKNRGKAYVFLRKRIKYREHAAAKKTAHG